MIQIKDICNNEYEPWGTNKSSISNSILPHGRVICEKAQIIPPAKTDVTADYFGPTYNTGRTDKVHKLNEFANSIILYKDKSIPEDLETSNLVEKRVYSAKQNTDNSNNEYTISEASDPEKGYEIKIWLENQYNKDGNITPDDFNIITLTTMDRIMDKNGVEVTPSSLVDFIGTPIKFIKLKPPTKIRVADYGKIDGFYVQLKRIADTTIHYLECVVPKDAVNSNTLTNEDDKKVLATQSDGLAHEGNFKGYFIEYQTTAADANALTSLQDLSNASWSDWKFVTFESFASGAIDFSNNISNDTSNNAVMATDAEADISNSVIWTLPETGPQNATLTNGKYGFISATPYSGGFSTLTSDINWSVSKAFQLPQGDNKFYRFRIRGLNNGNKNPGPVSTKYFYFRFNEPDQISWTTPPKFNAQPLIWDISLNWTEVANSSKADGEDISYNTTDLAIMEYKLQRKDAADASWNTISYWKNGTGDGQMTTHNYQIWPTPSQTSDVAYSTNWSITEDASKAEWVYYEETSGGTKVYTQEARLLTDKTYTSPYSSGRGPTFYFKIQARNYLFGKRTENGGTEDISTNKQWFEETTSDISDNRWSVHSASTAALVTTAHTSDGGYTPVPHDNNNNKYEIKFYEQNNKDAESPWDGDNTDYSSSSRPVNYTNNSSAARTTTAAPYNATPDKDYIAYQWQLPADATTTTDISGLSIDRYEIIDNITFNTLDASTNVIYSPDFRYGPANWHIREYVPPVAPVSDPSFNFKVRAFNFFNSTPSDWSEVRTTLNPTKPSAPKFLSSNASSGVNGKENSNPTFNISDNGITILVDEPEFTGLTDASANHYQNQAISLFTFDISNVKIDGISKPNDISLIHGHASTHNSGTSIQGDNSQVATFFHQLQDSSLNLMSDGIVSYDIYAKNVLKDEFSDTSNCTLTIGAPNPDNNFKFCPQFTWNANDNEVKLEFFRKTSTDILYDDPNTDVNNGSTNAPITNVTAGCNFSNTLKKLAWEVQCNDPSWNDATIPRNYVTSTDFTTNGDNDQSTSAYTIDDIKLADSSKNKLFTIDYKVRNQYNSGYFASTDLDAATPLQIKLTEPSTIGTISSSFTYGLTTNTSQNQLQINWAKPTQYGLYYKHQGYGLAGQNQNAPYIKTYKIYFNDGSNYYTWSRIAANSLSDLSTGVTISSNTTKVEKYNNSGRTTAGYTADYTISISPEKTYTIEKITAINWMFSDESPGQSSLPDTIYPNQNQNYPPITGSTTLTSSNAPKPNAFSNFQENGILISGTTTTAVKKLGERTSGTAVTNVLLNASAVKDTTSTMGIKIKVTGGVTDETSECKFNSTGIVGGNNKLTLIYSLKKLAVITIGTYSDLYDGETSVQDNSGYWFTNSSIRLNWHADSNNITSFYGKNLIFNVVVTYYDSSDVEDISSVKQIETGYYDKTITEPTNLQITDISHTDVFKCCGLPILKNSDTLKVSTQFDNISSTWVADTSINTIRLGNTWSNYIINKTTTKSNHNYNNNSIVTLIDYDLENYSGTTLIKDAQIRVKAKNCEGISGEIVHDNKYIWDPKTLDLITIITGQNLATPTIETSDNVYSSGSVEVANKPFFNVLKVPTDFNPLTDHGSENQWYEADKFNILDVSSNSANIAAATNNNTSQILLYDGKFISETKFLKDFPDPASAANYHTDVTQCIANMSGVVSDSNVYADDNNNIQDTLKDNYRWGIFSISYKNTSVAKKGLNYAEFSLGNNGNCNFKSSDLAPSGSKSVANVEIWYKCINDGRETRWNKLCEAGYADKNNTTSDVKINYTSNTAAEQPSGGWILNAADTTVASAMITNEATWANTKRIQFLIYQEVEKDKTINILIAIGVKNDINRYFSIPRAYSNNFIYRISTGSIPYNAETIG